MVNVGGKILMYELYSALSWRNGTLLNGNLLLNGCNDTNMIFHDYILDICMRLRFQLVSHFLSW